MSRASTERAERFAQAVEAMKAGDVGPFLAEFSENMVAHVPPALPWSPGTLRGPAVLAELLAAMLQWSEGHYDNEVVHVGGEGDIVVTVNRVSARHAGRSREYETAWTYRYEGDTVVEAWLISSMSEAELGSFWARPDVTVASAPAGTASTA